jgi:hypothetical protein
MIFWQSLNATLGSSDIWCKATTDGIIWSNAAQLTICPWNDAAPSVAQMKDGKIWLTWASDRNVNTSISDIFYKVYDGVSWSNDTVLTPASGTGNQTNAQPAIVQAIDGNILIFWVWNSNDDLNIYYTNSTNNGLTWSTKASFIASSYDDEWPAVIRTRDTRIWVAWMSDEADNYDIYLKGSLAGDVNNDGTINVVDLTIIATAYGTRPGEEYYNYKADINKDGIVDMIDIWVVAYYIDTT